MATVFTQLAPLIWDAISGSVAAAFRKVWPADPSPWRSEYVMRDDYTGLHAQRVYALAPQIWERLSTQPPPK
jgi:hypothetical protein